MAHNRDGTAALASVRDRASSRHKVFEPIRLITNQQAHKAHLLNISSTGALVHSATPVQPSDAVELELDDGRHAARVVWCDGSRFGAAFDSALAERLVAALLK